MKELSLRPYFGSVRVCKTVAEYQRNHLVWMGERDGGISQGDGKAGRFSMRLGPFPPRFIVWGKDTPALVHELSHVVLEVFEIAGIDPRKAEGEPFCYMLQALTAEALKK